MVRCHACGKQIKRGQTHCSQCGEPLVHSKKINQWKYYLALGLVLLFISGGFWLYTKWNEPLQAKDTPTIKDEQQSFSASTSPEASEKPAAIDEVEGLPETEIVTGTFYEAVPLFEVENFMYSFVNAFTNATYNQETDEVELFLAPDSTFESNTLDYLQNTLFAREILEDQLETTVVSMTVDGVDQDKIEDNETAHVTTNETYRIIREDSTITTSFETTYAVVYRDGTLLIEQNLKSTETAREEETN